MKKLALLSALLISLVATSAKAEIFVWKDPQFDIKVTYPDNWMRQAQLDDDMRLFVLAPQGMDHAACRLYAAHDGLFMDAPAYAGQEVSGFVFSPAQVQKEMIMRPDTSAVQVVGYSNGASLGQGAAVMANVNFMKSWAGMQFPMRALVVASQYHGDHVLMSCETLANAWTKWEPTMQAIMKSVSWPSAFAPEPNGLYRRFQDDGGVILPLNRRADGATLR